MPKDEMLHTLTLPSGLRLTLLIQGHGHAAVPGMRRALYTVQPDDEQGVRPSRAVIFSYMDRGRYLDDAAYEAERILKVAEVLILPNQVSLAQAGQVVASVKAAFDGVG